LVAGIPEGRQPGRSRSSSRPAGSCQHVAFVQRGKVPVAVVRPGAAGRLAPRGRMRCLSGR